MCTFRAILHDEERYPNPEAFDPARFLDDEGGLRKDVLDPMEAFGYGRRICPGRYFALDFIWLAMANILAAYTIDKPIDELGNVVEPTGEYVPGVVRYAPRSTTCACLLKLRFLQPPCPFQSSLQATRIRRHHHVIQNGRGK